MVAQDALQAGGFAVLSVTGGEEALDALKERTATLCGLVTDIRLGAGPTGWDIAKYARELQADMPIFYTTGDSAADWPIHGVPNSAVVQKPYAPAQLLNAISTLMTATDTHRPS